MVNFQALLMVMGLGALGVAVRYWLSSFGGDGFPWPTLAVNAIGSLIMGYLYARTLQEGPVNPWIPLIMVGFLGALTTYSSFSLETLRLIEQQDLGLALLNVLANNGFGIGLCYLGYRVGSILAVP